MKKTVPFQKGKGVIHYNALKIAGQAAQIFQ
jgi:hypothetical protein